MNTPLPQHWIEWTQRQGRNRVLCGGAFLAVVLFLLRGCLSSSDPSHWVRPQEISLPVQVSESGLLQPIILSPVVARANGNIIQVPQDGVTVTNGQALFLIDEDELSDKIEKTNEQIEDYLSDIEVAKNAYEVTKKKSEATLAKYQARLDYAAFEQNYKLIAIQPDDRRILEMNLEIAGLDLIDAEAEFERMQKLVKKSFAAASQLDPLERRVDSARTYLEELKLNLQVQEKGITREERIALQAEYDQAKAAVERRELHLEATLKTQKTAIEQQEAVLRHYKELLVPLREQEKHTQLAAPVDGVIRMRRKLNWATGGWQPISTGTKVSNKDVLADIVSPQHMRIEIMVHESDISLLSTGMPVEVELTAYPGQRFPGSLTQLSSLGQDRADLAPPGFELSPAEQAVFRGVVDFDIQGAKIQPGMSAQIHISISTATRKLVLPREAVGYLNHQPHVQVRGEKSPTAVQGAQISPQWFEVTGGISKETRVRSPANIVPEGRP